MGNKRPTHFCGAVERILGLAAVEAEWRHALQEDWPWAQSLLRPTDRLAPCYPKLGADPAASSLAAAAYEVVWRDEAADRYVGSCPHGMGTIELRRADLVVYELNVPELARRLASAMGLVCDCAKVEAVPHALRIGVRDALGDDELWAYLVPQAGPAELADTVARLAARHERPFALMTPTRAAWRPWPEPVRGRASVLAVDQSFLVTPDGTWVSTAPIPPRMPPTDTPKWTPGQPPPASGDATDYLPDPRTRLVLSILAAAKTLMNRPAMEAETKLRRQKISQRTVGKIFEALLDRGLIDFPEDRKKGARLTPAGRALASRRDRRASA